MSSGKKVHLAPVIPVRLPSEAELAATARGLEVIGLARQLADWLGDTVQDADTAWGNADARLSAGEALGLITKDDYRALAQAVISGKSADEVLPEAIEKSNDFYNRLQWIYEVAFHAGYIHSHDGRMHRRPGLTETTVLSDRDMLDSWSEALDALYGHGVEDSLGLRAVIHGTGSLDFDGLGIFPVYQILENKGIATVSELSAAIAFGATEGMSAAEAKRAWDSWVAENGDPTPAFLRLAEEMGVLTVDGDTAELTPLGTWDLVRHIDGVKLEHLPPTEELSGDQVLICRLGMRDAAFGRELEGWLAARSPADAVTEILTAGTAEGKGSLFLTTAVAIATGISGETEAAWRAALDIPAVRPYAVAELNRRAGRDPLTSPLPGFEPGACDQVVMSSRAILASYEKTSDPAQLAETVRVIAAGYGSEAALFDRMWRSRHIVALDALKGIGLVHPDKKTAKAARAAAHKGASAGAPAG